LADERRAVPLAFRSSINFNAGEGSNMAPDTIYALATGASRSAIAVIRLSGPLAGETLRAFTGGLPAPRVAALARFREPKTGETLDSGLALWFPAPHSATGEDYAEFHIHGGRAVIDALLTALGRREGAREAAPGEFARRGFLHGKLDLSQAEALADLIDAQTEFQRRQAIRVAGGELRRQIESWRCSLVNALALVEAELDFSDEGDVGAAPFIALEALLAPLVGQMREVLRRAPASERLRDGFTVLILGPPNAGKSTLMNALARREVAIVSTHPGTTRDMIEVHLDIDGMPVTFVDTAGLREAADEIEKIGINRVLERVKHADLLLWLSEGGEAAPSPDYPPGAGDVECIRIASKADLAPMAPIIDSHHCEELRFARNDERPTLHAVGVVPPSSGVLPVSAKTGQGLDELFRRVADRARDRLGDGSAALLIRERHRRAVAFAAQSLEEALAPEKPLEIVADDLRGAGRSLARIVGAIDVEDVLDAIFSRFCIGK
jgi:tRNA modification GTPase